MQRPALHSQWRLAAILGLSPTDSQGGAQQVQQQRYASSSDSRAADVQQSGQADSAASCSAECGNAQQRSACSR